jgi:ATPases with chaperone activity, ATP-binding subunit
MSKEPEESRLLREEVSEEDIARVVATWTGIPVSKMLSSESQKYLDLEGQLTKRVVGQEAAVKAVSDAIRRNRAGLSDPNKPLGSFLFVGPTGVGKTELAKALAEFLFSDEKALTRIDMSEYMDEVLGEPPHRRPARLRGLRGGRAAHRGRAPPALLGRPLRRDREGPPDVFNVLLQLLDDGRLTDGQGRLVDFKNAIVIMTSNLGSDLILEAKDMAEVRRDIDALLKTSFKPEFLNRIDETVVFERLGKERILAIVDIQLGRLASRLQDRKIKIDVSAEAKAAIAEAGYDPQYGARPLKRAIQGLLQNPLAQAILSGKIHEGDTVKVGAEKGEINFKVARK